MLWHLEHPVMLGFCSCWHQASHTSGQVRHRVSCNVYTHYVHILGLSHSGLGLGIIWVSCCSCHFGCSSHFHVPQSCGCHYLGACGTCCHGPVVSLILIIVAGSVVSAFLIIAGSVSIMIPVQAITVLIVSGAVWVIAVVISGFCMG